MLGVGYLAQQDAALPILRERTTLSITEDEVLILVNAAMADRLPQQTIIGLTHGGYLTENGIDEPIWFRDARFAAMRVCGTQGIGKLEIDQEGHLSRIEAAQSMSEATDIITAALMVKLSKMMSTKLHELDPGRSALSYGVDSLVAVGLRAWAFKDLKCDLSIFDILGNEPLSVLAAKIAEKSPLIPESLRSSLGY